MSKVEIFRSAFTKAELIDKEDTLCVPGNPIILGMYEVPAGELVSIGYGQLAGYYRDWETQLLS